MRILFAHNYYQLPGGEDEVFESTRDLMRSRGHEVFEYIRRNDEIKKYGAIAKLELAPKTVWAWDTRREFARVLRETKPEIVQFGNIVPLISPAAYAACREAGVAVVQSLDNPRLMCPSGNFFRDGAFCTDCSGRLPWPGVLHGCYRASRVQTAVVAGMIGIHRMRRTWQTYSLYNRFKKWGATSTDLYRSMTLRRKSASINISQRP